MDFYICKHCGNLITFAKSSGVPVVCCGEPMDLVTPNTTDAAGEKHVPVVTVEGTVATVNVGSVTHPMTPEHFIQWIVLETDRGVQGRQLTPQDQPTALFYLAPGEQVIAAHELCNLHGLWKS